MSLSEIFGRISDIFGRVKEGILWVWHYPIPWQSVVEGIGQVALVLGAIGLIYFLAMWVIRLLGVLPDLAEITFLLARRQYRKLRKTRRG